MRRRPAKARPRRRDGPPRDAAARDRATDDLREFADRMSEAEQILGFGAWRWELASGRVRWSHEPAVLRRDGEPRTAPLAVAVG
jgi:hypothetical protein